LTIAGIKEASYVVPKYALMFASPVFKRMFANGMTEKSSGKLVIEDTNPEEFSDFLKAISPKQEHPTRELINGIFPKRNCEFQRPMFSLCSNWLTFTSANHYATVANCI
jgi:hypothetical protein